MFIFTNIVNNFGGQIQRLLDYVKARNNNRADGLREKIRLNVICP